MNTSSFRPLGKIALAGFAISLFGSLPLGSLNTMTMQIAIEHGNVKASLFAIGIVTIEMIYISITLYAVDWIRRNQRILNYAEGLTSIIFLVIAGVYFYKAFYPISVMGTHAVASNFIATGILLSAVNTAQFPFWIGWNIGLLSKGILQPQTKYYSSYVCGAGMGTLACLAIFIATGDVLQRNYTINQSYLHVIIGVVFVVSAVVQHFRIVNKKSLPTDKLQSIS